MFKITDGFIVRYKKLINCTREEIENKFPWLKEASVRNAVIEIDNGHLIWYDGIWYDGEFKEGTILGGKILGGLIKENVYLGIGFNYHKINKHFVENSNSFFNAPRPSVSHKPIKDILEDFKAKIEYILNLEEEIKDLETKLNDHYVTSKM